MNSEFLLSLLNQSRKDGFRLVCVTKNRSVDEINEALDLGVIDIGENRVQEAKCKFLNINKNAVNI
jgi:PLP dependent protein